MISDLRETTIQEFVDRGEADIKTGPFGTQLKASDYVGLGTPVINVRNIGFGRVVEEKLEYIDETTVERLKGHLLRQEDSAGRYCIRPERGRREACADSVLRESLVPRVGLHSPES